MQILLSAVIAFVMTVFSIAVLRPLCLRGGLYDAPGGRKHHQGNIPLMGGIAMFWGLAFALLTLPISLAGYRSLLAGCAFLVMLGVLDDLREISPRTRLIGQVGVGLLLTCWGQIEVQQLGNLFLTGDIVLHRWALPFTVVAVVGVINAVNMMDGLDGLAGGIALIAFGFLAGFAGMGGQKLDAVFLTLVLSVLAAFLCFNFPFSSRRSAHIFMGDAGSMFLGAMLTWFCVSLSQPPHIVVAPVTLLWVLAVPLFDMASVMLRRILHQQSPFRPDRRHMHHLLLAQGMSARSVTYILCGMAFFCGMVGMIADKTHQPPAVMFVTFIVLFIVYFLVSHRLWEKNKSVSEFNVA